MSKNMNILVTGYAGFIGFHLSKSILENTRHNVIGVDNFNNYYPALIKRGRSKILKKLKKNCPKCNGHGYRRISIDGAKTCLVCFGKGFVLNDNRIV